MRLREKWAVALAARYHCSTFSILNRPFPLQVPRNKRGAPLKSVYEREVLVPQKNAAMATLALLHRPICTPQDFAAITKALHTLLPREKWAHQTPSTA